MPDETYSQLVPEPPTIPSPWVRMGVHTRSYPSPLIQFIASIDRSPTESAKWRPTHTFPNSNSLNSLLCGCSFVALAFETWWKFNVVTWINFRVKQEERKPDSVPQRSAQFAMEMIKCEVIIRGRLLVRQNWGPDSSLRTASHWHISSTYCS